MSVDSILKNPVVNEQTETQRKIKNNIVAFSVVSIFIYHGGLSISKESTFLGLKFDGLTDGLIYLGLFTLIIYSCIHYLWYVYEDFLNYKLRFTSFQQLDHGVEYSLCVVPKLDDYRNNTLYNWWVYKKNYLVDSMNINESLLNSLDSIEKSYFNSTKDKWDPSIEQALLDAKSLSGSVNDSIKHMRLILSQPPFSDILPNFHFSFKRFILSQNIRWLVFEILFPFGLAFWALIFISPIVYCYITT
ncbi:hypothetical protein [Aeromonas caviae]|uniref:hypothetical protein n=1 Tax=Aeromonas caviae TaxID=648 RepID=UPI002B499FC3|nr:hypothetical protein [Aeromonas caviae]